MSDNTISTNGTPRVLILAVDDRPANLVAMKTALRGVDAHVVTAASGQEALSLLMKHEFAVVLLDVQMPFMDGFETVSLIRSNKTTSTLPIIFVTAISKEDEYVFKGYDVGAVDYLFKPINPTILQAKLNVFLDLYRHKRQLEASQAELTTYVDALKHSNEELEQLACVVSHDLQEPLRKVFSFCQMLQESCGDKLNEQETSYIEYAVDGATRMKALISDLLNLSRVGSRAIDPTPTCAAQALGEVLANLEFAIEEADARVTHDELPTVMADKRQLTQLFQNLVGNAIKYRSPDREPEVHVSAKRDNDQWIFSVRDNGIGIDSDYYAKIFEIFKRLHGRGEYSGTGIGLAICKKIVERLGGKIWIESKEGVGSTFFFTMDRATDTSNEERPFRETVLVQRNVEFRRAASKLKEVD